MITTGQAKVLVTGGAKGIGLAIAKAVVECGEQVVLWDIDSLSLEAALDALGPLAEGQVVDISDPEEVEAAGRDLTATHLVNNAGIMDRAMSFDVMEAAEIDRVFAVNVRGTLLVSSVFLRYRDAHPNAAIVNMSSIAAQNGGAKGHAVYGATKGALISLTAAMARDMAPDIRVNAVAPGIIDTDIQTVMFADRATLDLTATSIPHARLGQSEEVADAVVWLLFGASYVSGEVLRVAGGRK
jgi:3-oxoacyl-[acyl-carrier protein] reductase